LVLYGVIDVPADPVDPVDPNLSLLLPVATDAFFISSSHLQLQTFNMGQDMTPIPDFYHKPYA